MSGHTIYICPIVVKCIDSDSTCIRHERDERKIENEFHPGPLFRIVLGIIQTDFDQSTDRYYHQYTSGHSICICIVVWRCIVNGSADIFVTTRRKKDRIWVPSWTTFPNTIETEHRRISIKAQTGITINTFQDTPSIYLLLYETTLALAALIFVTRDEWGGVCGI